MKAPRKWPDQSSRERLTARLAALAHPARVEIIRHLGQAQGCCCREVVDRVDLAQSTISQHLKVLVDAGLVKFETDRRRSRYEIDREALTELSHAVARLVEACCSGHEA